MLLVVFVVLLNVWSVTSTSSTWAYKEGLLPDKWGEQFSACNGMSQSPIDLKRCDVQYQSNLGQLKFTGYDTELKFKLINNGHSVKGDIEKDMRISGGGLKGSYKLLQFHFHWGSDDSKGSEHTINTQSTPMEMHLVHYKDSYGSLVDALQKSDGLAVLGFFFKISSTPNENLKPIIKKLEDVRNVDDTTTSKEIKLRTLLPSDLSQFYRYTGSLTTPPCSQAVVWTLFRNTIPISREQLSTFRELLSSETNSAGDHIALVDNFRPVQNLNKRPIYSSFKTWGKPLLN